MLNAVAFALAMEGSEAFGVHCAIERIENSEKMKVVSNDFFIVFWN